MVVQLPAEPISHITRDTSAPGELIYSLMSALESSASKASSVATICVAACQRDTGTALDRACDQRSKTTEAVLEAWAANKSHRAELYLVINA